MMDTIKILQQNVLNWGNRKFNLSGTYTHIDPEVILINSHGIKDNKSVHIRGYNRYRKNIYNEYHDGIEILVKTTT